MSRDTDNQHETNISAGRNMDVGGDLTGRDKIEGGQYTAQQINITNHYATNDGGQQIPLELPGKPENFVGRDRLLARMRDHLHPGRTLTLCAIGGMGKTALSGECLHRMWADGSLPARFPDGVITYTFYQRPDTDAALSHIAAAYGERGPGHPADLARRALGGKRALLVLDGAEDAEDLEAVWAVRGGCGVLLTTRDNRQAKGAFVPVDTLDEADAVALLQKWAGRLADNEKVAAEIVEKVGRLPLAVRLAGKYMREQSEPAADYLAWLDEEPLEALDQGERRERSVPLLLARSLRVLDETGRAALAVAGLLALAPFDRAVIAAGLDLEDENRLRRPLARAVNYGLLTRREGGRYEVGHALIYDYVRTLPLPDDVERPLEKMGQYYTAHAIFEQKNGVAGLLKLDSSKVQIVHTACRLFSIQAWSAVNYLAWAVHEWLYTHAHISDCVTVLELAYASAEHLKLRSSEIGHLNHLGLAYRDSGKLKKSLKCHLRALKKSREIGDQLNESNQLGNLGIVYRYLGKLEESVAHHQQALKISQNINDQKGEGNALGNLALVYHIRGQMDKSVEYHRRAIKIARKLNDKKGEGKELGNLGLIYRDLGELDVAKKYFQQALEITREVGDRREEGTCLSNLGITYQLLGQIQKAAGYYGRALKIVNETGDMLMKGNCLGNLGNVYRELGQLEKAIEYHEKALDIVREIGDKQNEGSWLGNLGLNHHILGDMEKALRYYSEALANAEALDNPKSIVLRLTNLGSLYHDLGQMKQAIRLYQRALDIAQNIGDRVGLSYVVGNLGIVWGDLGELVKAVEFHQKALAISREIGDRLTQANQLASLGINYKKQDLLEDARKAWSKAIKIFEEIESPKADEVRELLAGLDE